MAIFREIVFTKTPLRKTYRYRDIFQLVPYKSETGPDVTKYVVDYPCFLEYHLPDTDDGKRDFEAELAKEREICVLLTAFSVYRVFVYDIHASSWGVKIPIFSIFDKREDEQAIRDQVSEFYYPVFYYRDRGKDLHIDSFTDPLENSRMKLLPRYYSFIHHEQDRFDVRNEAAEITFSKETERCLNSYYSLEEDKKKKLFSAARLISDCIALKDYRYSLSFLAGVAALETLADIVSEEEQVVEACPNCHAIQSSPYTCEKCGRPIWGIATKVKSFLKEYVSEKEEDLANYNKIYNLRSKITHTGDIFTMDSIFKSSDKKKETEFKLGYMLISYARQAMIGVMAEPQRLGES